MDSKLSVLFFSILYLLFLSEDSLSQDSIEKPSKVSRIGNGMLAELGQFPFIVSVEVAFSRMKSSRCTGAILNKNWVLTAAHCYGGRFNTEHTTTVTAGVTDANRYNYGPQAQVRKAVGWLNENFQGTMRWDLALLRVDEPFKFNEHVQPIALIETGLELTKEVNCKMIGFGYTEKGINTRLFYMEGYVIGCGMSGNKANDWQDAENICVAALKQQTSTCQGDSGGPLMCGNKLAGVLSGRRTTKLTGFVCGDDTDGHALYMSTLHYTPWIKKRIGMATPEARAGSIPDHKTNAGKNAGLDFIIIALTLYRSVHNYVNMHF